MSAKRKAPAKRAAPARVNVQAAVRRDLAAFDERLPGIARSGLAAAALVLARQLDAERTSPTARSMCARELREALDRLRELLPPEREEDQLDELTAKRAARVAGRAGT